MPFRFYFFLLFFSFLFLFYPGENPYLKIFAYNSDSFVEDQKPEPIQIKPIPVTNNAPIPYVTAEGVYVVELDSFSTLYEKNSHVKFFPASTTKMITALVAYDLYKTDDVITVKEASIEGQIMNLMPHERITVENLLYGMLVYSGNDAAYAFANDYGFDKFILLMNAKAQQIGMKDTTFKNPAGLDDYAQLTTPFDLALAGRELLQNPYLRKIVGTKEIIISDVDYKRFHTLTNVNKLLGEVQGLGGLKTGYTELAGENLVSFYRKDNHDYIIVIMKSQDRFEDTKAIVNWIDANVSYVSPQL